MTETTYNTMAAVEAPNGNASTTTLNTTSTSNGGPSATPRSNIITASCLGLCRCPTTCESPSSCLTTVKRFSTSSSWSEGASSLRLLGVAHRKSEKCGLGTDDMSFDSFMDSQPLEPVDEMAAGSVRALPAALDAANYGTPWCVLRMRLRVRTYAFSQAAACVLRKSATGQEVLDLVCQHMDLVEKDYFGLLYQGSNKHRYWVDLTKPLSKQIKSDSIVLRLRFRFYPANPILVKEEITRYQLFVQLQRDLLHGCLYCPQNEAAVLAALILQSELGDYDETEHTPGYVSEYKLLLKQSAHNEALIAEAHKNFSGLTRAQAEAEFLTRVARYDTYGFDPYAVKDSKQVNTIYIGVNHDGVLIYETNHKLHHIKWANVEKVDYVNKQIRIYPSTTYYHEHLAAKSGSSPNVTLNTSFDSNVFDDVSGKAGKKPMLKFMCPSVVFAKHLWRHILSQQAFFTEDEAKTVKPKFSKPRIPLLSRGSTFRLPIRKVLAEIETEPAPRADPPSNFTRYHLSKQTSRADLEQPWLNGSKYALFGEGSQPRTVMDLSAVSVGSIEFARGVSVKSTPMRNRKL
ncbi:hypothetical protein L596_007258 [Steinernema carpocapsae]|uniref:Moesin/ezrin/radixin homolog 1 n=1 Tax=Steinernema carpocapsae TaxID=34508 RepID=A0A4U5P9R0_STECR|nr:hypothetical protein L596_007258 [Steinernema carpocapsae]